MYQILDCKSFYILWQINNETLDKQNFFTILMEWVYCCQSTIQLLKSKGYEPLLLVFVSQFEHLDPPYIFDTLNFHNKDYKCESIFTHFSGPLVESFNLKIYVFSLGKIIFKLSLIYCGQILSFFFFFSNFYSSAIEPLRLVIYPCFMCMWARAHLCILSLYFWNYFQGIPFIFRPRI